MPFYKNCMNMKKNSPINVGQIQFYTYPKDQTVDLTFNNQARSQVNNGFGL